MSNNEREAVVSGTPDKGGRGLGSEAAVCFPLRISPPEVRKASPNAGLTRGHPCYVTSSVISWPITPELKHLVSRNEEGP